MYKYILKRAIAIIAVTCTLLPVYSQSDSSLIFTYEEFLHHVIHHHPIAKQATLNINMGQAKLLTARGNLDPVVSSSLNQKEFDDKLYFQDFSSKLTIPTQLGVDIVGGYENTDGQRLNPQRYTDKNGLWNVGVEVNVLQGLWVNERKTVLQQAKLYQKIARVEQQNLLNELIYNASYQYMVWQQYYFNHEVLTNNIDIAYTYLNNTKHAFANGEKTAMDTLEAFIMHQDVVSLVNKNKLSLIKAQNGLENYLWLNQMPIVLKPTTLPESYKAPLLKPIGNNNTSDLSDNPIILATINKLTHLQIEQRLNKEKLKPKLKLKYNALLATTDNSISPNYSSSNVKWGFDFKMHLFLRSERGKVRQGNIKIEQLELELENKRNELKNKLEGSLQKQFVIQQQIAILQQNVNGYKQLMDGESEKFKFGESSVFLLNKRQEKYTNGYLKLIETHIKMQMETLYFLYLSNQLISE